LAAITSQALLLCVEVMVGGLPEFGQPKALLTAGLSVDGVGTVWGVNFYGIFIACGFGGEGEGMKTTVVYKVAVLPKPYDKRSSLPVTGHRACQNRQCK